MGPMNLGCILEELLGQLADEIDVEAREKKNQE